MLLSSSSATRSICIVGALLAACSSSAPDPSDAATEDSGVRDGATDASGGSDASSSALGFTPSNVDLSGIDLTKLGDFVVDNDECTINTDSLLASCGDGGGNLGFKLAKQADGSKVAVYVAKSMTIQAGQNLSIAGSHPLVFIALGAITIKGTLNGNSRGDLGIAGAGSLQDCPSKGLGLGGGGTGTATAAGGGGSYCGVGGAGAAEDAADGGAASPGGASYGTSGIVPLVPGSSGGCGGSPGSGGGAIQLVAGTSITVAAKGLIQAGGGGGSFGGISGQEANGGGSGGSILLESPVVTVLGTLAANGGGGGAGTSSDVGGKPPLDPGGADSTPNAKVAAGGREGIGPSSGGNGSAAASIDGTDGSFTAGNSAGGGGGGAGRIRINTKSGAATLTAGTISPATSTRCTTQGTIR